jgi:alpha-tubulin suppressor-like RCC1 family protein
MEDVIFVSQGSNHIVGLRSDGTVAAAGENGNGECEASEWRLFDSLAQLKQDRNIWLDALEKERSALEEELSAISGLFSGGKRRRIECRLDEIEMTMSILNKRSSS